MSFSEKEGKRGKFDMMRFSSRHTDGVRRVQIRMFPNNKLWVHCTCPYFTYHLEYALAYHRASTIIQCNGMFPKVTNPKLRPYLCKHAYSATEVVMALIKGRTTRKKIIAALERRKQGRQSVSKSSGLKRVRVIRY